MNRFIAAILFCAGIFCLAQSHAQVPMTGAGLGAPAGGGGGYTGPGDCSGCSFSATAEAWWGLRCYSAAYSGNVVDIKNAGATLGSRLQCSGGTVSALISASACLTFVTGGACGAVAATCAVACQVVTLYDQSGKNACSSAACDLGSGGTLIYNPTCIGSLPCINLTASEGLDNLTGFGAVAQPFYISGVFNRTTVGGFNTYLTDNSQHGMIASTAADTGVMYVGAGVSSTFTATDNTTHAGQFVFDNAGSGSFGGSYAYIDGSTTSISLGSATGWLTGAICLGQGTCAIGVTANMMEFGISAVAPSTAQASALNSNQHTYWGF